MINGKCCGASFQKKRGGKLNGGKAGSLWGQALLPGGWSNCPSELLSESDHCRKKDWKPLNRQGLLHSLKML